MWVNKERERESDRDIERVSIRYNNLTNKDKSAAICESSGYYFFWVQEPKSI